MTVSVRACNDLVDLSVSQSDLSVDLSVCEQATDDDIYDWLPVSHAKQMSVEVVEICGDVAAAVAAPRV